jgi:hypothetical protein
VRCYLREGEGGGWGTGSDPLDGAAGERALHGCRWRESGDGEGQRRWEERKRGLAWLGSLLRAVPCRLVEERERRVVGGQAVVGSPASGRGKR